MNRERCTKGFGIMSLFRQRNLRYRVSIIIIITYLVGLGGFHHIIAGSTTMLYLVLTHAISWGTYLTSFFFPTLLGNIVGGVSVVAALGHAQVVGGKE
jgi:formate-nitrite transporter family protein